MFVNILFYQCDENQDENQDVCGPDQDGYAIIKIRDALTQAQTDKEPAGYFRTLDDEIDSFQTDITSTKDKIVTQINKIDAEKSNYVEKSTIDATFIS